MENNQNEIKETMLGSTKLVLVKIETNLLYANDYQTVVQNVSLSEGMD